MVERRGLVVKFGSVVEVASIDKSTGELGTEEVWRWWREGMGYVRKGGD